MKEKFKTIVDSEGRTREVRVLDLIIKQHYFDMILSGQKVQEFREVRPTTIGRLLQQKPDPENPGMLVEVEDEYGNAVPIEYGAIQFYVGYNKDRDSALVEVKDAYCEIFVDENDEPITYEYKGQLWVAEQVVFNLGKIYETNLHPKKKK